jgi:hypothetical protein
VESNKRSRRTWHANTIKFQQRHAFGYHYALRQQAKQLAREKSEIQKRKDSAIAANEATQKA